MNLIIFMTREILVNSSMYEIAGQEFLNISSALNYDKVVEEELLNIFSKFKFLKYHHFFKKIIFGISFCQVLYTFLTSSFSPIKNLNSVSTPRRIIRYISINARNRKK